AAGGVDRAGRLLGGLGEEGAGGVGVGSVGGREAAARHRPRLDAQQAGRHAAQVYVLHRGGVRVGHAGPAFEHQVVLVGQGAHDGADVEGLLAVRVRGRGEDLSDGGEVAALDGVRVAGDVAVE